MKRALCVILMVSMLLSMLTGCSDDDSPTHDETIVVDGLTIDTKNPDRTGLYDLYWIPLPTGNPFLLHNEIEYDSQIDSGTKRTLKDAFVSYSGDLVIPVYHWLEDAKYLGVNPRTGEKVYNSTNMKLLTISLTDFSYGLTELEFLKNELVALSGDSDYHSNIRALTPMVDGGYFGVIQEKREEGTCWFARWDRDGKRIQTYDILSAINAAGSKSILPAMTADLSNVAKCNAVLNYDYVFDRDGYLYISGNNRTGGIREVCVYSPTFEYLYTVTLPTTVSVNAEKTMYMPDTNGIVGVNYRNNTMGVQRYYFASFQHDEQSLGKPQLLPETVTGTSQLALGFDAYQVAAAGVQAHRYDAAPVMLLNWVDYDLDYASIEMVRVLDVNHIFIITDDPNTGERRFGLFSSNDIEGQIAQQASVGKTQLTLAYFAGSNTKSVKTIEKYVTEFNKKNSDYRVKLLAYSAMGNQSAEDMLVSDILTGQIPDMILFDSDMNYRKFDNLGIFADIYTFMDRDNTYYRDAFFSSVKEPFENAEGQLPYLTIQYGISTIAAQKDTVGNRTFWNLSELTEFVKTIADDEYFIDLDYRGKEDAPMAMLKTLLPNIIGDYVDYDKAKIKYENKFAELLEFCMNTGIRVSYNGAAPDMYMDNMIKTMLIGSNSSNTIQNFLVSRYAYFNGADMTYIGFPSATDCGSVIVPMTSIAITEKGIDPNGAWTFITACLDYQKEGWEYTVDLKQLASGEPQLLEPEIGFSSVIETAELMCETLKHYYHMYSVSISQNDPERLMIGGIGNGVGIHLAANGNYDENYNRKTKNMPGVLFYKLTDADAKSFLELLHNITMARSYDYDLLDIIYEDAQYYFNGMKSLEETVRIIENRVGIKLAE